MARVMQKRATSRRKLHIPRSLSTSKSVRGSSIVLGALLLYIHKLKLKLAALTRDYCTLYATNRQLLKYTRLLKSQVRVEKIGNVARPSFRVRVMCEKRGGRLVPILEAFEKMGLNIMQASVSCDRMFAMEAIAVAAAQEQPPAATAVTQALLEAIK
ncbi:uncharacterized protein LOC116205313 isoform X2 [Punica granatum]|uniref:Uncharacterized protein LOC116205313 isoform X2 n=1 Tax=Punica granatum TaxID=22663 RepID=A0A6P8DPC1_PUNGR|nr:uncharacterized protein LOC116205313 isoform X2 [Punica granatum]